MAFDFSLFGYSVPDYIKGLINAHTLEDPPVFSGFTDNVSDKTYVLGIHKDDLLNLGYRSINDLHILHSMNTSKTIEVLFLEGSPDIICFLITDNFLKILESDKSLKYLYEYNDFDDSPWCLYEVVSDSLGVPEDEYFSAVHLDDGCLKIPVQIAPDFFKHCYEATSETDICDLFFDFKASISS